MTRRFEPQDGARGLVPHQHRLSLYGHPASLDYPPLCPNCGASASHPLEYTKVFRRADDSDSPNRFIVSAVRVPFCDACIARHRVLVERRSWWEDVLASFSTFDMLGAVFPAIAAAFVLWLALKDLFHGQGTRMSIELGIAAVFGLIAWFQRRAIWDETAYLRVPPGTEITQAFDFSDDISTAFEPARFECAVRDGRFAQALLSANPQRQHQPGSPRALAEKRSADRKLWIAGAVLAVFALIGLFTDWLD